MLKWIPAELHTHTLHSDGKQTLEELAQSAANLGLECIAMTDHNTQSALADQERVQRQFGLPIISGMEWTTFYGHMLTLGVDRFIDWRVLGPDDIHEGIGQVHEQGGIAGIAHPFRIGSPICTGCFWEYTIQDWHEVDYIEVWSTLMPSIKRDSQRAFAMWTDLLNQGYRITAVSGRDWHVSKPDDALPAVTYLGVHDEAEEREGLAGRAVEAIRHGSVSVTMGPLLTMWAQIKGKENRYHIGECIELTVEDSLSVTVQLDVEARASHYNLKPQNLRLLLTSSHGICSEIQIPAQTGEYTLSLQDPLGKGWIRAELYGCMEDCVMMIAFTNPIYMA
ncbi:CehA/McbA family metallohydrolase [Paenibacillus polymyxa]|uniref:CehA/McbA family metallohydrolase n=1 Tax=Paenibacillus polymyxa TaxID=1406 RepID=A0AAP4EAK1_PAEPO|nr:CehA/McbA family metallohydrolase [Paenibacillus polymyxa]MDH2331009.1 CehA/McbA family metallohydrolase [Paenibacillus polymyxa]